MMTPDVAFEILASPLAVSLEAFLTIVSAARGETDLVAAFNPQGTPSKSTRAAGVAVVPVQGLLTLRGTTWGNSYNQIQNWLRQVAEDQQVEQIVLDVDSPGGAVSGAEETSEVVAYAASRKPVIAVSNGMMASAFVLGFERRHRDRRQPLEQLGERRRVRDLQRRLAGPGDGGIKQTIVAAGKFKAESAGGPLTDEAQVAMQQIVDDAYTLFVRRVSRGRRTSEARGSQRLRAGQGPDLAACRRGGSRGPGRHPRVGPRLGRRGRQVHPGVGSDPAGCHGSAGGPRRRAAPARAPVRGAGPALLRTSRSGQPEPRGEREVTTLRAQHRPAPDAPRGATSRPRPEGKSP